MSAYSLDIVICLYFLFGLKTLFCNIFYVRLGTFLQKQRVPHSISVIISETVMIFNHLFFIYKYDEAETQDTGWMNNDGHRCQISKMVWPVCFHRKMSLLFFFFVLHNLGTHVIIMGWGLRRMCNLQIYCYKSDAHWISLLFKINS